LNESQPDEEFVQLLTGHQNRIYTYILILTGNPVDARDIMQETNLVLWRKASEYEPGTNFAAWAATIARYQVMYFRRRQMRNRIVFDDTVVEHLAKVYDHQDNFAAEREVALQECLEKLAPADRKAIRDRYAEDGSVKGLAKELGRTPVATAAYLMRLRRKLFDCITRTKSREGSA